MCGREGRRRRTKELPTPTPTPTNTNLNSKPYSPSPGGGGGHCRHEMQSSSSSSSCGSKWLSLLRIAISTTDLLLLKRTHALTITSGHSSDRFLTNNLITAYSKCSSLSSACHLFDHYPHPDLVSWNSILSAYAHALSSSPHDSSSILHHHTLQQGFRLFRFLHSSSSFLPTKLTLAPVLKLCLISRCLPAAQMVHGYAVKIGLDRDVFVSGALVNIHSKLGRVWDAWALFNDMPDPEKDVVLWNIMLKAFVQMGLKYEAFLLFSEFHRSGLHPDDLSVQCVLGGVSESDDQQGNDMFVKQVQAYATKWFLHNQTSDVFLWNKHMSDYIHAGDRYAAVECFIDMNRSNVDCDSVTLVIALSAVTGSNDLLELGQQIHGMAMKLGFNLDVTVANSLINMYSKAGCLSFARKVFASMEELDLISWNSMITSYAQSDLEEESVTHYLGLLSDGFRPDNYTLASVLRAWSSLTSGLSLVEQIHVHALKTGIVMDNFVSTALIDVYSRIGKMEEAELLLQSKDEFDLASWNAMMFGYIICNNSCKALKLFGLMHKRGERSDEITLATVAKACGCLVDLKQGRQIHDHAIKLGIDLDLCVSGGILDMYIKCGEMEDARTVFQEIPSPDDVAWTTMISGCVENGEEDLALLIYYQLRQSGVTPDEYTFTTLIKASSCLTALEQGRQIHANVIKLDCASDTYLRTSLIDMYAKCGNIEDSYRLFKRTNVQDIALWNAMLVGLAQHGHGEEALKLFKNMKLLGIKPDRVTFIGVLSACSHSGLISEAYSYFHSMHQNHGIQPEIEHYSCLVDALGRAGHVQEAQNLIASMPFEASASMYRALLGACRVLGDTESGKRVASWLLALEPSDSAAYVLLSNIYASADQWDDMKNARKMMKRNNVKKDPGFSWIDVKNKMHLFVVDDRSHPQADMIYDKVEDLITMIKKEGYVPDTGYMMLDVEEEE